MVLKAKEIVLALLLMSVATAFAQTTPGFYKIAEIPSETKLIYTKEYSGSLQLHSYGFGGGFKWSKLSERSGFRKRSYDIEFVTMRHPKEVSVSNQFYDNAKSFVFGKENVFIVLHTGLSTDYIVFDKAQKNGVEIGLNLEGGSSLGLLKPVYLDVFVKRGEGGLDIESQRYDKNKHNLDMIYGGSGFFQGLDEIKILPGAYAKAALSFDWAKEDTKILCLETGVAIDVYPKKVPIFAVFGEEDVNKQYFMTFYAKVSFGKRRL